MIQIGAGHHKGALALGHLLAIDGQESVDVHLRRQVEPRRLEHAGPEQRVEVGDVLADEMVHFGVARLPPTVEVSASAIAPLLGRGDVANRRVEPNVPIVAGAIGNLKAEVRRRPRDIPIAKRITEKVPLQVVGNFRLQMIARLRPLLQKSVKLF